ncbi:MAG: ABC-type antimicrobial peptide transport system, ATPase component [Parcubacteria group bacterium GW2011_GWA1_50_14]|uniref:Macrolide ABC transporter ATP-binding protein n=1 Tax=Candidatus Liptonbacteria bacterium GWB1_49_6 TaxID=1798644 RepID=A0A1G2C5H0_9BACT|nr:MAG: ABC-type antimicrobial peptide transport system, ATPase component [Parcubacteria group bacterium GW2011_GWA1_50_14]OGY96391.1 MAG: macrolide ABC transporter ATP-binding protein [Candidatus Liptonbacteria bacterium GWB1_49_6]
MSFIETRSLRKVYLGESVETVALNDIDLSIGRGEFLAVMGPSGSGKSTLLHILGLLDRYTQGEYWFDGKEISEYSDDEAARIRNEKMGFVFQAFNLLPRASVLENVKLSLLYSSIHESEWDKIASDAIESVGLSHRIHHQPSQLSGGEKQRAAIARALVTNPDVIFADEPTGNLDSKSGQLVMETIQNLHDTQKRTIILITHETYTAEFAERVIHMKDGAIEKDIRIAERHDARKHFQK